jgi:hypothetical protein
VRPNAIEVLRGLQGALMADIGPEVQSLFGQDMLQTVQMLLETVTNELDGAVDSLVRDNQTLCELVARGADAVRTLDGGLAEEITSALDEPTDTSLTITALAARNQRLRGLLERLLVVCEDAVGTATVNKALMAARSDAYRHLREVATRGWSFWDVFSFRERMAQYRATGA